jgi:hypothetical protein
MLLFIKAEEGTYDGIFALGEAQRVKTIGIGLYPLGLALYVDGGPGKGLPVGAVAYISANGESMLGRGQQRTTHAKHG